MPPKVTKTTKVTKVKTDPKFLLNNAEAKAEWDLYKAVSGKNQAAGASKVRAAKGVKRDIGPDVYCYDSHLTGWGRSDSEWTAPSVTGSVTTIEDNGFQLHVAGFRIHASAYEYNQINIDDGSIPLQFYNSWDGTGYSDYNLATVSQKFMASWLYTPQSDADGYGNDDWQPQFAKLVVTVLEQDPNSNTATKVRLDFYRDFFGDVILAVQAIIENKDMVSYRETNVRYNITDAEINYITDGGSRENGPGDGTRITLWAPRNIPDSTVAQYDSLQVYGWQAASSYDMDTYWDDYSGNAHNFFEGVTLTRRVPYSAIDASLFFPRSTNTVYTALPSNIKNRDVWIVTIGVLVAILFLYQMYVLRNF